MVQKHLAPIKIILSAAYPTYLKFFIFKFCAHNNYPSTQRAVLEGVVLGGFKEDLPAGICTVYLRITAPGQLLTQYSILLSSHTLKKVLKPALEKKVTTVWLQNVLILVDATRRLKSKPYFQCETHHALSVSQ